MYSNYSRQIDRQRQNIRPLDSQTSGNSQDLHSDETVRVDIDTKLGFDTDEPQSEVDTHDGSVDHKQRVALTSVDHTNDGSVDHKQRVALTSVDHTNDGSVDHKQRVALTSVDQLWEKLCHTTAECHSLLKKHLTQFLFDQLKNEHTKFGGKLEDCIRSGCENTDSGVGVYASDPDAYTVFDSLLDAVIKDYHKVSELNHPQPDFGDVAKLDFGDLDPSGNLIVSTRVRVARSHDSYGFPPVLTLEDRVEMEKKSVEALQKLDGELKGTYFPLTGMTKETQKQLTEDHFLFNDSDRFLREAGGYNDWPTGRGIFFNDNKTFLVWVNEEDHLRFISMQKGGNLQEVYARLVKAIKALEGSGLSFAKREGLGYLTFCPSNLGTTLRASVHIKIPKLSASPDFKAFCDKLGIQARGIHGEHTESVGGVYDISNKRRLGLTEIQAIQEMRRGVEAVIAEEKKLGGGLS